MLFIYPEFCWRWPGLECLFLAQHFEHFVSILFMKMSLEIEAAKLLLCSPEPDVSRKEGPVYVFLFMVIYHSKHRSVFCAYSIGSM